MNPDVLEQMSADQDSADEMYKPSKFWQECNLHILELLEDKGIENFRTFPYFNPVYRYWLYKKYQRFFDAVRALIPNVSFGKKIANGLDNLFFGLYEARENYRIYLGADKANAPPITRNFTSALAGNPLPKDVYNIDHKDFTSASLKYLKGLAMLKKNFDLSDVKTVLEIGGGYGALGEILLKEVGGEYFYIGVDIPPVTYFATYYLQEIFGEEAVLGYDKSRNLAELDIAAISQDYRAMVLCPWQLQKITGKVDLAVNYTSFQEMEATVVKNYVDQIANLGTQFVLTLNKKFGIKISQTEEGPTIKKSVAMEDIIALFNEHGFEVFERDGIAFGDGFPGTSQEAAVLRRPIAN